MPPGNENCLNSILKPGFILGHVRINFAPGAFEVDVAYNSRSAVARTGDVKHIQVVLLDNPVQVHVDEVLARRRAPVGDHQRLNMRESQRLF